MGVGDIKDSLRREAEDALFEGFVMLFGLLLSNPTQGGE